MPSSRIATYVLAGLAILPLLVSEGHVASSLGSGALLLLERLAGGTRADGGVLVEAVFFDAMFPMKCRDRAG